VATEIQRGDAKLQAGEEIETQVVDWNTALQMVESGQIRDAKTLVALMLYDRRRTSHREVDSQ
jgi:hypothetical protein